MSKIWAIAAVFEENAPYQTKAIVDTQNTVKAKVKRKNTYAASFLTIQMVGLFPPTCNRLDVDL